MSSFTYISSSMLYICTKIHKFFPVFIYYVKFVVVDTCMKSYNVQYVFDCHFGCVFETYNFFSFSKHCYSNIISIVCNVISIPAVVSQYSQIRRCVHTHSKSYKFISKSMSFRQGMFSSRLMFCWTAIESRIEFSISSSASPLIVVAVTVGVTVGGADDGSTGCDGGWSMIDTSLSQLMFSRKVYFRFVVRMLLVDLRGLLYRYSSRYFLETCLLLQQNLLSLLL